ncbi:hypothetical protein SE15_12635 [Thermanaerothrix daxensis]|uniref:Uncharacterized protein n=1 Tax=Thermanaerothrix daxensis TaxID=869279 RepID=A0A0P6Y1F1_9CHLR|nr:hypothetical protein [Thermanaerothrix daxensis]KPL82880.1 hypothetical protein SE15_12635 [Thermanaerothrix daxensis]
MMEPWKRNALILGAALGLISGVLAAYLLIQRAEQSQSQVKLTAQDGVKVGISVLSVLRQIAELGSGRR